MSPLCQQGHTASSGLCLELPTPAQWVPQAHRRGTPPASSVLPSPVPPQQICCLCLRPGPAHPGRPPGALSAASSSRSLTPPVAPPSPGRGRRKSLSCKGIPRGVPASRMKRIKAERCPPPAGSLDRHILGEAPTLALPPPQQPAFRFSLSPVGARSRHHSAPWKPQDEPLKDKAAS